MSPAEHTVYIAEDEPLARAALESMFRAIPGWRVLGSADDGRQAFQDCVLSAPDLLVTDVRMPLLSGLDLVAALRPELPHLLVVFITAYDQHALAAFRLAAVDYLLKPVSDTEFLICIGRVTEMLRQQRTIQRLDAISTPLDILLRERRAVLKHLVVRSIGRIDIVQLAEIIALRADGNYVDVITAKRTFLHRETMKSLLDRLDPRLFVQIHRSTIVAITHVRGIDRGESGTQVLLDNDTAMQIGPRYLSALQTALDW